MPLSNGFSGQNRGAAHPGDVESFRNGRKEKNIPKNLNRTRLRRALFVVNGLGAAAAAAFAVVGLARPNYVEAEEASNSLTEFWAASSAVRTWAITIPLLGGFVRAGHPSPELLTVAGLVQLGDSALGVQRRNLSMALAPAAIGLVHLASARLLSR